MRYFVITKKHIIIAIITLSIGIAATVGIISGKNMTVPAFAVNDIMSEVLPVDRKNDFFSETAGKITSISVGDILNKYSPFFKSEMPEPTNSPTPISTVTPVPKESEQPIEKKRIEESITEIKNETIYEVSSLDYSGKEYVFPSNGVVLIVHTHTTESYAPENSDIAVDNSRNVDEEKNVIAVGDVMTSVLQEKGIEVIHDKTIHDYPSYQGAYNRSLNTVKNRIEENTSIAAVLDIHRDAIIKPDGTRVKLATDINGESCAQIMVVCGTNGSGLTHPDWKKNLHFGIKLTETADKMSPGLMRPINLREERFNQHMTDNSLIIEVGTNGNTLTEAKNGAKYFAEAVADVINNAKK